MSIKKRLRSFLSSYSKEAAPGAAIQLHVRWVMLGSICFEVLKLAHQCLLLYSIPLPVYGLMGSIFSLIFLTIKLSRIGDDQSFAPFIQEAKHSKDIFRTLIVHFIFLQIPILLLTGAGACYFLLSKFYRVDIASPHALLVLTLIVSEGCRTIMRPLLHNIFLGKKTIFIELLAMLLFLGGVWGPYLLGMPLTLNLIFYSYLLDSLFTLLIFSKLVFDFYKSIPDKEKVKNKGLIQRIWKSRFFNYSMSITKNLFTGNFIVTLFSLNFGLQQAGVLKFASYVSDAIRGVIHTAIGYSGGTLLAHHKVASFEEKKRIFSHVFRMLNTIIYTALLPLILWYTRFESYASLYTPYVFLPFIFALIFISLLEHLFIIYESFYIIEERGGVLLSIKILEALLVYGAISFGLLFSPFVTITNLIVVRIVTFLLTALYAYKEWGVKPTLKTNKTFIVLFIVILLLRLIFYKII
jgi:hypothetical protein